MSSTGRAVRALWLGGWLLLATMVVHVVALAVVGGPLSGPVSLRKPATFAETGWLMCWSLALVLPLLPTRPWQRAAVAGSALAFGIGETAVIGVQAWRGVPSHYNFTTALDAALMRGGAAGLAAVLIAGVVVLLTVTARSGRAGTPAAVRLGVLAGAAALLVACLDGLAMISINSGVYTGVLGSGFGASGGYLGPDAGTVGPDYAGFRPATAGGDLVLPHAVGVHGLVLLAAPAALLTHTSMPAARQLRLAALAAGSTLLAMAVLLVHASRQQPLDALPWPALAALAACTAGLTGALVAAAVALRRDRALVRAALPPLIPRRTTCACSPTTPRRSRGGAPPRRAP